MFFSIHLKDENSNKLKHSNYMGLIQSLSCYSMNNSGLILFYSSYSPPTFPPPILPLPAPMRSIRHQSAPHAQS